MAYWVFYQFAQFPFASVIAIVSGILAFVMLVLFLLTAGSSIRTSAEGGRPSRLSALFRVGMVIFTTIAIITGAALLIGDYAIQRASTGNPSNPLLLILIGPETIDYKRAAQAGLIVLMVTFAVNFLMIYLTQQGSALRLWMDRFRGIRREQKVYGSSHFATSEEFRRFRKDQRSGVNFYGRFMGNRQGKKFTYLGDQFSLHDEDAARGMITIGNPGSGKSQSVILPVIYDSMRLGQNIVVADPQLELTKHVVRFAAITGHRVIVHDPTNPASPRYNIASNIRTVSEARSIADVLIPKDGGGSNDFWEKSAEMLLAACLMRFDNIGDIYTAFVDIKSLGDRLGEVPDDTQRLAASFIASTTSDGKFANNVIATLSTSLTGWADETIRNSTTDSDFEAVDLVDPDKPTVLILASPGKYRRVVAPYLGAVLTKILLDLDAIGEKTETGALPIPVKFIVDEFPALGDLSAIVEFANLVRKRRIAFLLACQTLGQLEAIYGKNGAETLLAGMAFQVVFGGCDQRTAEFYSGVSGAGTETQTDKEGRVSERQRKLLTPDEIVRPPQGNCTIFGRYVTAEYATYVIVLSRLTRLYERRDVAEKAKRANPKQVILFQRGEKQKRNAEVIPQENTPDDVPVSIEETPQEKQRSITPKVPVIVIPLCRSDEIA